MHFHELKLIPSFVFKTKQCSRQSLERVNPVGVPEFGEFDLSVSFDVLSFFSLVRLNMSFLH